MRRNHPNLDVLIEKSFYRQFRFFYNINFVNLVITLMTRFVLFTMLQCVLQCVQQGWRVPRHLTEASSRRVSWWPRLQAICVCQGIDSICKDFHHWRHNTGNNIETCGRPLSSLLYTLLKVLGCALAQLLIL